MYEPVLHIVLYQPEIPYNAGAVGRTCVALGAKLWLVRPLGFRIDNRYMRRAGLDYWPHLVWEVVDDWNALLERLPDRRPWLFTKTATRVYTEVGYEPGDVLVFGSESAGLPPSMLEANRDRCLRIPIRPQTRSLNVSVSVGVVAFEARRQWEQSDGGGRKAEGGSEEV
jgi:tRNA (cytidine/uridine-2'-O-)-methyltransferase